MTTSTTARFGYGEADDDLVIRARTETEALAALYERYYPRIYRYCLHRLFLSELAEDVTSAVFLQVARHIVTFTGSTEAAFRNWVYAIATNQANSHLRGSLRRREIMEAAARRQAQAADGESTAHFGELGRELDWPTVYEAIASLKPQQQTVITLRFFEEMPFSRIAEILECKPVSVRVTCSRALAVLREKLGKAMGEER
jgi:RNA polymerase sigma-70 factor (ECF subfamily)